METTSIIPSVAERPTVASTRVLRPIPVGTNMNCVTCCQPVAHWRIKHARYGEEEASICALCFLYTSGWLVKERVRRVEQVAQVIELKRNQPLQYVLGERGDRLWPPRLVQVKDADDVLGALTLHDRFEMVLSQRRTS
jgi:hypothetical protein